MNDRTKLRISTWALLLLNAAASIAAGAAVGWLMLKAGCCG